MGPSWSQSACRWPQALRPFLRNGSRLIGTDLGSAARLASPRLTVEGRQRDQGCKHIFMGPEMGPSSVWNRGHHNLSGIGKPRGGSRPLVCSVTTEIRGELQIHYLKNVYQGAAGGPTPVRSTGLGSGAHRSLPSRCRRSNTPSDELIFGSSFPLMVGDPGKGEWCAS